MGAEEPSELRQSIAAILDREIFGELAPELRTIKTATVRPFVEKKLELAVKKDDSGRHYTYAGYGEKGVFAALNKILARDWAFSEGKALEQAVRFENGLLDFLRNKTELSQIEIPENIFRESYREGHRYPFANIRYLRRDDDDHAEYLCRRFLDKCADEPRGSMGLRDSGNSGLVALIALETFHANGIEHGKITFSDLFDDELAVIEFIDVDSTQWPVRRVRPIGKPRLSHSSIGRDVRERYSGGTSNKFEQTIKALQERVLGDFLNVSIVELYPHIRAINGVLEQRFNSGSLFRTILDVEKGAIFVYQVDHGRFWAFGFCPIEGKVDQAEDVLRVKIIEHYENAIRE